MAVAAFRFDCHDDFRWAVFIEVRARDAVRLMQSTCEGTSRTFAKHELLTKVRWPYYEAHK